MAVAAARRLSLIEDLNGEGPAYYKKLREQTLQELRVQHPTTGAPVSEFWYFEEDGRVMFDDPTSNRQLEYERLVTDDDQVHSDVPTSSSQENQTLSTSRSQAHPTLLTSNGEHSKLLRSTTPMFDERQAVSNGLESGRLQQLRYAKLISQDQWSNELVQAFVLAYIMLAHFTTQCLYCLQVIMEHGVQASRLQWSYIIVFAVAVILWLAAACWHCQHKVSSHASMGDAIQKTCLGKVKRFLLLMLLNLCNVRRDICDAPIVLHPRKAAQPYAFLKLSGCRCHIVGWPSKDYYEVFQQQNFMAQGFFSLATSLPMMLLQLAMNAKRCELTIISALSLVTTVISFHITAYRWGWLMYARARVWRYLEERTSGEFTDKTQRELLVWFRAREELFGTPLPEKALAAQSRLEFAGAG